MKTVLLLHDAFANPTNYWYPAIESIIPSGYTLIRPELPAGNLQGSLYWMKAMETYAPNFTEDTIVITHGISSLLAIRQFEKLAQPIRTYISIAGCGELPEHKVYIPIAESFLDPAIAWADIQKKIHQTVHIWNHQDPFITANLSERFSELLPGTKIPLNGSEHFTEHDELELFASLQQIFTALSLQDSQKTAQEQLMGEQQKKEQLAKESIPSTVTYDTDVAKSVSGYQGAVISELLATARQQEVEKKEQAPTNPKNIFFLVGSIILILASIIAIGYGLSLKVPSVVPLKKNVVAYESKLLRVESINPLELAGKTTFDQVISLQTLQKIDVPEKTFASIVPLQSGSVMNLQTLDDTYNIKFPIGFAGKADDYLYGMYKAEGTTENIPFLLVKFEGYDIMYSIMYNWEPSIAHDLELLFYGIQSNTLAEPESAPFNDQTILNIPMRVAELPSGRSISYGFLTDSILLITPSPIVGEPILRRIIGR